MERDKEVVFGEIFPSFKGSQHSKRNLWCKSIHSRCCKKNAILPHQTPTLLFYHIILQHRIYQMFYPSILYIKIIFSTH